MKPQTQVMFNFGIIFIIIGCYCNDNNIIIDGTWYDTSNDTFNAFKYVNGSDNRIQMNLYSETCNAQINPYYHAMLYSYSETTIFQKTFECMYTSDQISIFWSNAFNVNSSSDDFIAFSFTLNGQTVGFTRDKPLDGIECLISSSNCSSNDTESFYISPERRSVPTIILAGQPFTIKFESRIYNISRDICLSQAIFDITVQCHKIPTSTPTFLPSLAPTSESSNPTKSPSQTPANVPTLMTSNPTLMPTLSTSNPSLTPTSFPSVSPSSSPTDLPTEIPTTASFEIPATTPFESLNANGSTKGFVEWWWILVISILFGLCTLLIFFCFRNRKESAKLNNSHDNHQQAIETLSPTLSAKNQMVISGSDDDFHAQRSINNYSKEKGIQNGHNNLEGNDNENQPEGAPRNSNNNNDNKFDIKTQNDTQIAIQLAQHYNDIKNITDGGVIQSETKKPNEQKISQF